MNSRRDNEWLAPAHDHRPESVLPGSGRKDMPRALRLTMAAGTVLAGFCLVAGLVALSVAAGDATVSRTSAGGKPAPTASAEVPESPDPASPAAGGGRGLQVGRTLASLTGAGVQSSLEFLVPGSGTWGLTWSYHGCPAGPPPVFTVGETMTKASLALRVAQSASSDHGTNWFQGDPGWHSLVVISRCSWQIQVVAPRNPEPPGSPGSPDSTDTLAGGDNQSQGSQSQGSPSPTGTPSPDGTPSPEATPSPHGSHSPHGSPSPHSSKPPKK